MDPHKPLIDIIIICYNYGHYLLGAVESALKQTYQPIKITLIDDASTDNTEQIANRFPQITYIKNEKNIGLMKTLKKVIDLTSAPFFALLSADDELEFDFLEKLYEALKKDRKAGFAYSQIRRFDLRADIYKSFPFSKRRLIHCGNYISETCLIKRETYNMIGGHKSNMESGQEDWDLWLSFIEQGFYGVYVPKPLFRYRIHKKSKNYAILTDAQKMKKNIALIKKNHPKLYGFSYKITHYPYRIYDLIRNKIEQVTKYE